MENEPGTRRPNHRAKYIAAAVLAVIAAIAAVGVITGSVPDWITRATGGAAREDLYSSQRLDAELDVVRTQLGDLPLRRVTVTTNLISVEAVAADGQLHDYWVRDGKVEDMDSIPDLHAGETAFTAADLSGQRVRSAVADVRNLGKPGELQQVTYEIGLGYPLSVAVWIRHDPLSSVLYFDPQGGSTVVREQSIPTDEHTSVFGGCWC
jgi:hypothetical protein